MLLKLKYNLISSLISSKVIYNQKNENNRAQYSPSKLYNIINPNIFKVLRIFLALYNPNYMTSSSFRIPTDPATIYPALEEIMRIQPLSDPLKQELVDCSFSLTLKKGEYLLKQGEYSKEMFFIVKGILSGRSTLNNKTITTFISHDGNFVSSIDGLYGLKPCSEDIQAEEDTVLLGIPTDDLHQMFDRYIELNMLMRKILESYYQAAQLRSIFIRVGTATEKYQYFLTNFSAYADRIPLEVTASYLNIQLVTLQKIIRGEEQKKQRQQVSAMLPKSNILEHMDTAQPFLQKKITLSQLSQQLHINAHQLSHLLNLHFNQNFNCFINSYRVDYVLKQLSNRKHLQQYSIEGLGQEAGFTSKSTFYSEFKKITGCTPAGYLYNKTLQP